VSPTTGIPRGLESQGSAIIPARPDEDGRGGAEDVPAARSPGQVIDSAVMAKKKTITRKKKSAGTKKTATLRKTAARRKKAPGPGKRSRPELIVRTTRESPLVTSLDAAATSSQRGLGAHAAGQSGDTQGLSDVEADSESVEELMEEGQSFEAEAVAGVEDADAGQGEVRTRQVREDDVPLEYLENDLDRLTRRIPLPRITPAKQTATSVPRVSRGPVDAPGKHHRKPLPPEPVDKRMGEPRGRQSGQKNAKTGRRGGRG
jgi:hypothetical protein